MAGSNTENFQITISGHNMTLVTLDGGYDVKPVQVRRFNLHLGERVDVILCADQPLGNYLIHAQYDYACSLTKGHFIPPGFDPVSPAAISMPTCTKRARSPSHPTSTARAAAAIHSQRVAPIST